MLKSGFFNVEKMKKILLFVLAVFLAFGSGFIFGNAFRDYVLGNNRINFDFKESENIISEEEKNQILETLNAEAVYPEKDNPQEETKKNEHKFVGSLKSDKFYSVDCSYAKRVKEENKVWFDSIEAGEAAGRTFVDCQK